MGKKKTKRIPRIRYKFAGDDDEEVSCWSCMTDLERDENGIITNGVMCDGGEGPPYDNSPNLQPPHFTCNRCLCHFIRDDIEIVEDIQDRIDPYDKRSLIDKLSTFCEDRSFRCVFHHRRAGATNTFRCPGIYTDTENLRHIVEEGEIKFCRRVSQDMSPENLCEEVMPRLKREKNEEERRQQERLAQQKEREERERREEEERIRRAEEEAAKAAMVEDKKRKIAQRKLEIERALRNVRIINQTLARKPELIMRCPNPNCNVLLADWAGCGQMKCDNCRMPFCVVCGEMFPNDYPPGYPITHEHVTNCEYRIDKNTPNKNPFVSGNVALRGRLFIFQREFNDYLRSIPDENIKNAVIIILREQVESEFEKLFPHRHDHLKIDASQCTADLKHRLTPDSLPDFQKNLLRKYKKDFLSLLRVGTGICMPDSWYYFITYPEPQRNQIVNQMVEDYNYFKKHNTVFRPEVGKPSGRYSVPEDDDDDELPIPQRPQRPQIQQIPVPERKPWFFSSAFNFVTSKILNFFGKEQQAAQAAVVYNRHEHPLDKNHVIAAVNFQGMMVCDSCGQINQPGYISCSEGCNYQECLKCAIEHGYITEQEAVEQLEREYPLPEADEDRELEQAIAASMIAKRQRDTIERDFQIALALQEAEE